MAFSQTLSPVQGEIGSEIRGKEEILERARDRGKRRSTEQDKREIRNFGARWGDTTKVESEMGVKEETLERDRGILE